MAKFRKEGIIYDLPGVEDPEEAKGLIETSLKYVQDRPKPSKIHSIGNKIQKFQRNLVENIANQPTLRSFSNAATAGLSEPAEAGLSALVEKAAQLTGKMPERSLAEAYNEYRAKQSIDSRNLRKENPIQAIVGELSGYVAPGTVMSKAYNRANALVAPIGAGATRPAIKLGAAILRPILRGGMANVAYQGINPESGIYREGITKPFATGAAMDLAGTAVGSAIEKGIEKGKTALGYIQDFVPETPYLRKWSERFKNKRFAQDIKQFLNENEIENLQNSGTKSKTGLQSIANQASDEYHAFKRKILDKFGDTKVSPEGLRQALSEESSGITEFATDISKEDKDLKDVFDKWQELFAPKNGNPSLQDLDKFTTNLYKQSNKTNANPALKRLYSAARQNLFNAMDDAVKKAGERTKNYLAATKKSEELTDEFGNLLDAQSRNANPRGWAQKIGAERTMEALNKTKGELHSINDIIDALDSKNEEVAKQAVQAYRGARERIAKNLAVNEGPLGKLSKGLPEEVITRAIGKGKLNLGSNIDQILDANPSYKDPIRNIILTDIVRRGTSIKNLNSAIKTYEEILPRILEPTEIAQLQRMGAGLTMNPSLLNKGGRFAVQAAKKGTQTLKQSGRISPMLNDQGENNAP